MLIYGLYKRERISLEITQTMKISDIKKLIRQHLNIADNVVDLDHNILTVNYAGTELKDDWILAHLGLHNGVTVKIAMRQEVKPILFIKCAYNGEVINLYRDVQLATLTIGALKTIVTQKTGIPVGVFRLMGGGVEMYDCHMLDRYGVDIGDTVKMVTWDGWSDFLKLATLGYTSHVLTHMMSDEYIARYQMRVALCIAAYFGHVDLAVTLMRHGVQPDEPVGEHPVRQWCPDTSNKETLKTPIHIAAERGQLGVLRALVTQNICSVMTKDGFGLMPLNVALRAKQKQCISFLLTKQWSRIPVSKSQSLPLALYAKIRKWCDEAKERVFLLHGQIKSSIKKRHVLRGPLVSHGVNVDGFSHSQMNGKSKNVHNDIAKKSPIKSGTIFEEDPESYFRQIQNISALKKYKRRKSKVAKGNEKTPDIGKHKKGLNWENKEVVTVDHEIKLPTVPAKTRLVTMNVLDEELPLDKSSTYISTGQDANTTDAPLSSPSLSRKNPESLATFGSLSLDELKSQPGSVCDRKKSLPNALKRKRDKATALIRGKFNENSIPLPIVSANDTAHPNFIYVNRSTEDDDNLAKQTLDLYERYRGMKAREYAIQCMVVANSFNEKPWLERVRMAVSLNAHKVKHVGKLPATLINN